MKRVFFLAMLLPLSLCATELKPWFGNVFELEARGRYVFQNFQKIQSQSGSHKYVSNDSFATASLATNIYGDWDAEFEITGAQTRAHCFNFDNARLTGRYMWLDDIIGDPVSVTSGITLIQASGQSLRDPGSFHHGAFEAELHTAVGRETACGDTWSRRWWFVGAVGMGIRGVPWLRGDGVIQFQRYSNILEMGAYTLWGTGDHNIGHLDHFKGYGLISHQSIDIGMAYIHRFDIWGSLTLGYRHRVYAQNFPENVNYLIVEYFFPFGL